MFKGTTDQLINALECMPIRGGITGQHVAFAAAGTIMQQGLAIDHLRDEITQLRAELEQERELADRLAAQLKSWTSDEPDYPDDAETLTTHATRMSK